MNPFIHLKETTSRSIIASALLCFALLPTSRAVSPPPDGGYANANTAEGYEALFGLTTGGGNTAVGFGALFSNAAGSSNTANGSLALRNTTGSNNIGLGALAGRNLTTGSNNIDIGNQGVVADSDTIRIGTHGMQAKTFIAGISDIPLLFGSSVVVTTEGQLGISGVSSARFKDGVKPMDKVSEAILALKPVTFHYKKEIDPAATPQFGLVAEDVEKVNPALITRDGEGKPYTVRYDQVNAMLLNEFLKEHKTVEAQQSKIDKQQATIGELKSTVARQQKGMEALTTAMKEQAAQIQKVSAQLEMRKPAAQTVLNSE